MEKFQSSLGFGAERYVSPVTSLNLIGRFQSSLGFGAERYIQ